MPASARRPISARTALCGILLHPAGHTRSPAMHAAAYAALDFDGVYLAFDVPPAGLSDALRGARALGIRQLAISLPHKQAVMAHLGLAPGREVGEALAHLRTLRIEAGVVTREAALAELDRWWAARSAKG